MSHTLEEYRSKGVSCCGNGRLGVAFGKLNADQHETDNADFVLLLLADAEISAGASINRGLFGVYVDPSDFERAVEILCNAYEGAGRSFEFWRPETNDYK